MQFGTTFWVIFSAVSLNVTAVNRCVFETIEEGLMWYRLCEAVFVLFFLFFRFLSYGLMTLVSCKKKQRISYASCSLWHYFNTCFFFLNSYWKEPFQHVKVFAWFKINNHDTVQIIILFTPYNKSKCEFAWVNLY